MPVQPWCRSAIRVTMRSSWAGLLVKRPFVDSRPSLPRLTHVVTEALQVRPGSVDEQAAGGGQDLAAGALGDHRRHPGPRHPGVVAGVEPVVVRQRGEPALAPLGAPGVLHQETDVVVADDAERVTAQGARAGGPVDDGAAAARRRPRCGPGGPGGSTRRGWRRRRPRPTARPPPTGGRRAARCPPGRRRRAGGGRAAARTAASCEVRLRAGVERAASRCRGSTPW